MRSAKPPNANYLDGPRRQVPGYDDLLKITTQLLSERVLPRGRVLVLGAGGGLELAAMAAARPGWSFTGVDPSAEMLDLARWTAQDHLDRITLHQGLVDTAPDGPFDGATSLLVLHFVAPADRLATLRSLRRRLRPGAPLVVAHLSFPRAGSALWLDRHILYGVAQPLGAAELAARRRVMQDRLTLLDPAEDEAMLQAAGFGEVQLVYAGMALRGWLCHADG